MNRLILIVLLLNNCSNQYYNKNKNSKMIYENHNTIKDFMWRNRILILVNVNDELIFNNIKKYDNKFIDRDVLVINFDNKSAYINNFKMNNQFHRSLIQKLDTTKINTLFLIGKDGKIKEIYNSIASFDSIIQKIDSMPMRKREMKKKSQSF